MTTWPYRVTSQNLAYHAWTLRLALLIYFWDYITWKYLTWHFIALRQEGHGQTLGGRMGGSLCLARPLGVTFANSGSYHTASFSGVGCKVLSGSYYYISPQKFICSQLHDRFAQPYRLGPYPVTGIYTTTHKYPTNLDPDGLDQNLSHLGNLSSKNYVWLKPL